MAKTLCKCGKILGTSRCPSPYLLRIFYFSEIESALADLPKINLDDFICNWDEVHQRTRLFMTRTEQVSYWFCPHCKRVYEFQDGAHGRCLRQYRKLASLPPYVDISNWKRIYCMTDTCIDRFLDRKDNILLASYLAERIDKDPLLYISPDEKEVLAFDPIKTDQCIFAYEQEEEQPHKGGSIKRNIKKSCGLI